jgi:hypothetical protein
MPGNDLLKGHAEGDSPQSLATAIYGTILATALIAAYSEDSGSDPLQVAVAVFVAALVFWVAHAYSDLLAHGLLHREEGIAAGARADLDREWPLVAGAVPPILPLLLAPIGLLSDDNAETAAMATGILLLAVVGVAIALRRGSGLFGLAISAASSLVFGSVIVMLKAFVA